MQKRTRDLAAQPILVIPSPGSATSCAACTCSGILRTPPRAARRRSGPARSQTRCAASSTPPTWPATAAWATVPGEMTAERLTLFRRGVAVGLFEVRRVPGAKSKQPPARTLLECLRHREADVLRFLTDTAIPPTSNQRDLRPSKTQQKISGRLRSEKATRDRYAIRGYASTAVKHGVSVFTAIRGALAGTPGYRLFLPTPEPHPEPVTHGNQEQLKRAARRECSLRRLSWAHWYSLALLRRCSCSCHPPRRANRLICVARRTLRSEGRRPSAVCGTCHSDFREG